MMNNINDDFGFLVFISLGCRWTFQRMTFFPEDSSVFKSRTTITGIVKALRRMKGRNKQDERTFKGQD